MDLSGIISIGGMPGLYKVVAQSKNGIIVESIADKKRMPAYSSYKISALEDISVFTTGEDMPLSEVFQKIFDKEKGGPAIDTKKSEIELKKYFGEVLPEYDQDRVYASDIKKALNWYNLLQKMDMLKQKEEVKQEETSTEEKPKTGKVAKEKATTAKAKPKETGAKPKANVASKARKTQTIRKTGA